MEGKIIVPKRWNRQTWHAMVREHLDKKFRYDERVKNLLITSDNKCLVTTAKPILHDNPYHRIEFETQEGFHEYEIVPRKCFEVMEG